MTHRLPANIRNVIAVNPDFSESVKDALERLARGVESNDAVPVPADDEWDSDYWLHAWQKHRGDSWHDTPWFFGETYAFRLLLSATRYFENRRDPYAPLKARELKSGASLEPLRSFASAFPTLVATDPAIPADPANHDSLQDAHRAVREALYLSTWGNTADISFAYGNSPAQSGGNESLLLLDHSARAAELMAHPGRTGSIHIVNDNSGAELAGDLVLALAVHALTKRPVVLHPKFYPTYVSDTIVEDIHLLVGHAVRDQDRGVSQYGTLLSRALTDGGIRLLPDPYWCETELLVDRPPRIDRAFREAALVIIKGDFNYRRVFRDTIWSPQVDPDRATGLFETRDSPQDTGTNPGFPAPVLLLRTMKSDCLAGVSRDTIQELDRREPRWRTAGTRALIQLVGIRE